MIIRFRSGPVVSTPKIDRENGILRDVSVIELGEAKGHGMSIDETTLKQVLDLGNASKTGLISRFTHPGACDDATGKRLGRVKNLRADGSRVIGDLHLADFSAKSPDGDLREYVMARAEEEPDGFGMSIVFVNSPTWRLSDGTETPARDRSGPIPRPSNAVGVQPFARVKELRGADVVDEPAATSGMFSAAFSGTTQESAAEAFELLDHIREQNGLSLEQAQEFIARYFSARGLSLQPSNQPAGEPALPPKGKHMTPEQLKALKAKHPEHAGLIVDLFADGKGEPEILNAIKDVNLASANERNVALAAEVKSAKEAHVTELAAKDKEISDLKAEIAKTSKANQFANGFQQEDPGADNSSADETGDGAILKEWAAMSDAKKANYFKNIEVYREAKLMEAHDRQHAAGKEK